MDVIQLVKKAKRGNKEALLQLIMKQKDEYYKLAYTYMGNQHDAMDAMEDMIVRLYENIHQLKKESAFYSWSKTILVNSCKTLLKKRKKFVLVDEWEAHPEIKSKPSIGNDFENSEQYIDIQQLLLVLNEQQAEAIKLKYLLDLDYQTISGLTNVSIGTVKSRIFQGMQKLKNQFGGKDND